MKLHASITWGLCLCTVLSIVGMRWQPALLGNVHTSLPLLGLFVAPFWVVLSFVGLPREHESVPRWVTLPLFVLVGCVTLCWLLFETGARDTWKQHADVSPTTMAQQNG